jgi:2-polyprenyl-3-methyl-5-hydroxy-6-metoxy-1,4-benzoquinol methylase
MKNQILSEVERKNIRADLHKKQDMGSNSDLKYNKKIKFFLKYTEGKSVLDLGSVDHYEGNYKSQDWLFKALVNNSKSIVGLDYYEKGVVALQKLGFNIIYGDAQDFKFNTNFDVVTAGDIIEHLTNLDGFLKCVSNVLQPGGILVISTPNPWCWKYVLYHLLIGKLTPINKEHTAWFCVQTLTQLLNRYNFEIIEHKYSSHRLYENLILLPKNIKHTTLNLAFKLKFKRNQKNFANRSIC